MTALIFEIFLSGHHSIYLSKIIDIYLKRCESVIVVMPEKAIEQFLKENPGYSSLDNLKFSHVDLKNNWGEHGLLSLLKREFGIYKVLSDYLRDFESKKSINYIVFPYLDYLTYALGVRGKLPTNAKLIGIAMRPSFHWGQNTLPARLISKCKEYLFLSLLKRSWICKIYSIDPLLVDYIKSKDEVAYKKLGFFPDPVDSPVVHESNQTRLDLGTNQDSKVLMVYGVIDERKNIKLILDALNTGSIDAGWTIWLIGKQSDAIRLLLNQKEYRHIVETGKVLSIDRFVSKVEEEKYLSACDVVWVVYSGHLAMSGVLVKAGVYGKPVLGSMYGLISYYIRKFDCGISVPENIDRVVSAFDALNSKDVRFRLGNNGSRGFSNFTWNEAENIILREIN